jgi:hypothetical protein
MRRADPRSDDDRQHSGDDATEPLRSIRSNKVLPLQPLEYASWISLIAPCGQEAANVWALKSAERRGLPAFLAVRASRAFQAYT